MANSCMRKENKATKIWISKFFHGYVWWLCLWEGMDWQQSWKNTVILGWGWQPHLRNFCDLPLYPINPGWRWVPVLSQGVPDIAKPVKSSETLSQLGPCHLYDRAPRQRATPLHERRDTALMIQFNLNLCFGPSWKISPLSVRTGTFTTAIKDSPENYFKVEGESRIFYPILVNFSVPIVSVAIEKDWAGVTHKNNQL